MLYSASFVASTVSAVRQQIGRHALLVGLATEHSNAFVVAVGEILANAVVHGGGGGEVVLCLEPGRVRCVITDRGVGMPSGNGYSLRPDVTAESGRGLWLALMLSSQLTLKSSPNGTRIELCKDLYET